MGVRTYELKKSLFRYGLFVDRMKENEENLERRSLGKNVHAGSDRNFKISAFILSSKFLQSTHLCTLEFHSASVWMGIAGTRYDSGGDGATTVCSDTTKRHSWWFVAARWTFFFFPLSLFSRSGQRAFSFPLLFHDSDWGFVQMGRECPSCDMVRVTAEIH
ncbi:hypothetical protein V8G54_012708 [Vigna mungo]|uniref:Uncharacterized protein n=1 Tax=Vigna mungo TaxID=3915 RepID=A0AAQ3NUS3_VIGMU